MFRLYLMGGYNRSVLILIVGVYCYPPDNQNQLYGKSELNSDLMHRYPPDNQNQLYGKSI